MPMDRFLIAPINTGLETDLKAWLIPDDAFAKLNNAYVFRGRVRKRFGSILMGNGTNNLTLQLSSRLRINLGNTDVNGNLAFTNLPGTILKPGALFSAGDVIFTVTDVPSVIGNDTTLSTTPPFVGTVRLNSTGPNVYQFRITGGVAVIPVVPVYFYPAEPVMGIDVYQNGPINNQPTYAFDTQFAYTFPGAGWQRSGTGVSPLFHGGNDDFFWTTTWQGTTADLPTLFVTNFNVAVGATATTDDAIWYTSDGSTWSPFTYSIALNNTPYTIIRNSAGTNKPFIQSARIIVPFKGRLLLLNTIENSGWDTMTAGSYATSTNTQYVNRVRWCINGSPFAGGAWLEPNQVVGTDKASGAGFADASTFEAIISAEFIKDRLIVYFERSTWELAYTGNEVEPFRWQKINTELGSESTFSTVPFDKDILTIGNTGVHACNGANVQRIDNKIPDSVFEIEDKTEGVKRVWGIRDYYTEMVYWTFPTDNENTLTQFPNRVLVFNYKTGSWAFNDDTITCFGYFEQQTDTTWNSTPLTWQEYDATWASGVLQGDFRQIVAGNQQGWVFIVAPDTNRNCPALQITDIDVATSVLTVIDHNLTPGEYVAIENAQGVTVTDTIAQVLAIDVDEVTVGTTFTGSYIGGGTLARVSNIEILSKQWNPYVGKGLNFYLARIDFLVDKTANGEITVDYYPSSTSLSMIQEGTNSQTIMGTNILETTPYALYPLERQQDRLWHPIYFQTQGECIQIAMYFSEEQITDPNIAFDGFQLHGLVLHTQPTSVRLE